MSDWGSRDETKSERADRILAGLRHLSRRAEPRRYSHAEIGDVCGVDAKSIYKIEQKALQLFA